MATPAPAPPPSDPASERIRLLVNPPRICPWCCAERGELVPPGTTNAMCQRHRQQVQQGVRR